MLGFQFDFPDKLADASARPLERVGTLFKSIMDGVEKLKDPELSDTLLCLCSDAMIPFKDSLEAIKNDNIQLASLYTRNLMELSVWLTTAHNPQGTYLGFGRTEIATWMASRGAC